jgi:hypothetical protein
MPDGLYGLAADLASMGLNVANVLMGFRVDYTVCTDHTVSGQGKQVVSNMPIRPASNGELARVFGGRELHVLAGGNQEGGPEAFIIARDDLVYNGVVYPPTNKDFFYKTGTASPKYSIDKEWGIHGLGPADNEGGWMIVAKATTESHAHG